MTQTPEFEGEPIIRDKRRLDPETGTLREAGPVDGGTTPVDGGAPDGGAGEQPSTGAPSEAAAPDGDAEIDVAGDLADQLARSKAEVYNLDQRFNAYVRRSRTEVAQARTRGHQDVVEALIGVLDDIDLARQHDELSGPFASIADKLESVLQGSFGMSRFGEAGEEFDPGRHEALMHSQSAEATGETVQQVLQPGYRVGEKVVRPARVAVVGPQ